MAIIPIECLGMVLEAVVFFDEHGHVYMVMVIIVMVTMMTCQCRTGLLMSTIEGLFETFLQVADLINEF